MLSLCSNDVLSSVLHCLLVYFCKKVALILSDIGLQRYVHIDIDDVFRASIGTRMTSRDVGVKFVIY